MPATFPGGVKSFSTKLDGAGNTIFASYINDLQDEVVAIETSLLATGGSQQFDAGTVAVPSVGVGDSDVGLYSSGTNALDFTTNGVKALGIDATQFIDSPTQPRCRLYHSTTQSLNNSTQTAVVFDSEDLDVATMHDTGANTSRVTVPAGGDGLYLLTAKVSFAANATGQRNVRFRKNGSDLGDQVVVPASAALVLSVSHTMIDAGAAGDYYEVFAFQNSGGSLNVGSATRIDSSSFCAVKLW